MIRQTGPADAPAVEAATASTPGLGPRVWAKWRIQSENPRYPGAFYLVGEAGNGPGLLFLDGAEGMLCDGAEAVGENHEAELLSFLDFMRVRKLRTFNWLPPGWRDTNDTPLMVADAPLRVRADGGHGSAIVDFPPAGQVCAVLAGAGMLADNAQAQSDFASDYNIRRNHGVALVAGLRAGGQLAATAGATAIAPREAHISGVATLPEARGRGYASALLAHLQAALPGRTLSLFSRPAAVTFYTDLGFYIPAHIRRVTAERDMP